MSVTEHLMRPGNGSVRFVPEVPLSITAQILDAVNTHGCQVVITPTMADASLGDTLLDLAIYTGRVTDATFDADATIEFSGLSSWLDSYIDAQISRSNGTPAQWLSSLLDNGLTVGSTSGANVTRNLPAYVASRRECLDDIARVGGWEWRINPDMTVDTGTASNLWQDPPRVVVTRHEEGADGDLIGVQGSVLGQRVEAGAQATKGVVLGAGQGGTLITGISSTTRPLNAPDGSAAEFVAIVNSGSVDQNANAVADDWLAMQGIHRRVNVQSSIPRVRTVVSPGDHVWAFDPESGLVDTGNQVVYRGDIITPIKVRLLSLTWPVERGMGVFIRTNEATPRWIDCTSFVAFEGDVVGGGASSSWEVGDWNPPSYGVVNRTNPAVEARVTTGPMSVTDLEVSGDMSDPSGRRFVRTDTTRVNPAIVQRGRTSGTTNGSGDLTITIDNPLQVSGNTVFIPTRFTGGANIRGCHVVSQPNTTQFVVRCWNASGLDTNTSVIIWWIAIGPEP